MTQISIRINGESIKVSAQSSLSQALILSPAVGDEKNFVIALNQNFIARSQYDSTLLKAGDDIELLSPMSGG
jgi:sulfur carrier protein